MAEYIPSLSSDEVFIGQDMTVFLTPTLETMETDIANKAASAHTHSGYATSDHTHSGYATSTHAHAASEITGLSDALALKADVSSITAKADLVDGKVPTSQLPSFVDDIAEYNGSANFPATGESGKIYVDTSTNTIYRWSGSAYVQIPTSIAVGETCNCAHRGDHGKHAYDHSINGDFHVTADQKRSWDAKAAANHTHAAYAMASHDHDDMLHTSGGTINGALDVLGVIRSNSQQAFYFANSTSSQTIGTGNATGGTTIACGANANTVINGANVKMKNTIPQASNTYTLGSTTYRWKNIYANNAVNVASDERMKRDIVDLNESELVDFVNNLHVVSYNYKDDPEDADSRIGLIAQDVQKANADVAKFFVAEDENGYLGLKPADLVFPLIVAVQKLSDRVNDLEAAK